MAKSRESLPVLGVSVVLRRGRSVLLVRRRNEPNAGRWSLPGGKVAFGEKLGAAALRELYEETGIVGRIERMVGLFEMMQDDTQGGVAAHFVIATFAAAHVSGTLAAGDDATAAAWVAESDLGSIDVTEDALDAITRSRMQ